KQPGSRPADKTPPGAPDEVQDQATGDTSVPGLHDKIIVLDKTEARRALNQLSGNWAASIASRLLEDSRFIREAALLHTGAGPLGTQAGSRAGPARHWHHACYSSADRGERQGTPGDARDTGGLVLGGTHTVNDTLSISAYLGAQQSRMRRTEHRSHAQIDSQHA